MSAVRTAVRRLITTARKAGHLAGGQLAVAVSGGADSLALAAAAQHQARRLGLTVHGLIVDHGLQSGSDKVAAVAAEQLTELGLHAQVLTVEVDGPGGMEAAARRARYAALRSALPAPDAIVLLGHTRDDQAETVLLGLGRGSGPRSIAGMRPSDGHYLRPLLGLRRSTTAAACQALGLTPWQDPHNDDPAFQRVRLRRDVLPLLDDALQGGVAEALARTAALLQDDLDALDGWADSVPIADELDVSRLTALPRAVRTRVLRAWLRASCPEPLTAERTAAVDALVTDWHGQGPVNLPGGVFVLRVSGRLTWTRENPQGDP